jgi:Domain of unknown function (DUF6429)
MEIEIDEERTDEVVSALLYLTTFKSKPYWRAWQGHNWDSLDRLHQKGYISDPATKAKTALASTMIHNCAKLSGPNNLD